MKTLTERRVPKHKVEDGEKPVGKLPEHLQEMYFAYQNIPDSRKKAAAKAEFGSAVRLHFSISAKVSICLRED